MDVGVHTYVAEAVEGALQGFLFEGKTPALYSRIEEALRETLVGITNRRRRDIKIEMKPGLPPHSIDIKIPLEQFVGMSAKYLGFLAGPEVPDVAVLKRDPETARFYFEWVEMEFTLDGNDASS